MGSGLSFLGLQGLCSVTTRPGSSAVHPRNRVPAYSTSGAWMTAGEKPSTGERQPTRADFLYELSQACGIRVVMSADCFGKYGVYSKT